MILEGNHASDSTLSMETKTNWFNRFQRGRTTLFDDPLPGSLPKTETTEGIVTAVYELLLKNGQLKVQEIADTLGISKDCVDTLHEMVTSNNQT